MEASPAQIIEFFNGFKQSVIEHGVGVATSQVYELKEVSDDFFDEDEG